MDKVTAQDALDSLLAVVSQDSHSQAAQIGGALIVALREIIALQKRLDEKPGDLRHDADGNPLSFVMEDGSLQVSGMMPGVKLEGDMFVPTLPKTDENYQTMFEALRQIATVTPAFSGGNPIQIARGALTRIGYSEDENDGNIR